MNIAYRFAVTQNGPNHLCVHPDEIAEPTSSKRDPPVRPGRVLLVTKLGISRRER